MMEAFRIVQDQGQVFSHEATTSAEKAALVDTLLEMTKPKSPFDDWHPLISGPFLYVAPTEARFRRPQSEHGILYAAERPVTALYEHSFQFLKERMHLLGIEDFGDRTVFSLAIDPSAITDITGEQDIDAIMDRNDYSASCAFIKNRPDIRVIQYPSCRDPGRNPNYAALDIFALAKGIGDQRKLFYIFDQSERAVLWKEEGIRITWDEVR